MPLTKKGSEIMAAMKKTYKSPKKAESVFYAAENKGTIKGVHKRAGEPAHGGKKK